MEISSDLGDWFPPRGENLIARNSFRVLRRETVEFTFDYLGLDEILWKWNHA